MYNFEFLKKKLIWVCFGVLKWAFFGLYGENSRVLYQKIFFGDFFNEIAGMASFWAE